MPFTHKSNGVLKENDVRFFEEHDVSMRCRIFYFLMVILAEDATPVFRVFADQQSILEAVDMVLRIISWDLAKQTRLLLSWSQHT